VDWGFPALGVISRFHDEDYAKVLRHAPDGFQFELHAAPVRRPGSKVNVTRPSGVPKKLAANSHDGGRDMSASNSPTPDEIDAVIFDMIAAEAALVQNPRQIPPTPSRHLFAINCKQRPG
jgi:hypothetical protein